MADEADLPENDEELVLDEEDQHEPEAPEGDDEAPEETDEAEEDVFAFGDDEADPQDGDSGLVKHLREEVKRARKEAAEARRASTQQEQVIEVGEKPTLAGCDYDEDKFEAELDAWKERDRQAKEAKDAKTRAAEAQQKQWEDTLSEVQQEKASLSRSDADDALETVRATLGDQKNALIIHTADKGARAKILYALAKNPAQLEKLAQFDIQNNPIGFIKEVTKLEGQLKMVKRRRAPEPDTPSTPSASIAPKVNAAQKQLDKMEAEWERKGGDRRSIIEFKKKHGLQ